MPLMLVSVWHNANIAITGTIFVRSRWLKWDATWLFWSCDAIVTSIMWCQWHHQWHHCICLFKIIKIRCNMTFLAMWFDAIGTGDTIPFLKSQQSKWDASWLFGHLMPMSLPLLSQLKWGATWPFWSCDGISISNCIIWCHWHWCQMMPLYWCQHHVMWTTSSIAPLHSLHQKDQNEVEHDFLDHATPFALVWVLFW